MDNSIAQTRSILQTQTALDNSGTRHSLKVKNDVFVPLVFHKNKFIAFKRKHLLFLEAYREDVPLSKAAMTAGLTEEQAIRFLRSKPVRAWLHDLAKEAAIKVSWDRPEKWFMEGHKVWAGERQASKAQIEVWKAFGERVAPKPAREQEQTNKIEITIDPAAVQAAMARQQSIESEIVMEHSK